MSSCKKLFNQGIKENQKNRICWKLIFNNSRFVRHEFMCDMSVICWNPQIFQMLVSVLCFFFLLQNKSFPLSTYLKKTRLFWWLMRNFVFFFKDCGQDGASLSFLNNVCSNDLNEKKKGSSSGSPLNVSERYVYCLHCCLFTIFYFISWN